MSTRALNDFNSSPCSLVSGWPQESDLSHRQQGTVLRTSWNTSGVSHVTTWTWCLQYMCPWKPFTCRLCCVFQIMIGITVIWYPSFGTSFGIYLWYSPNDRFVLLFLRNRKKPLLFYFNILKCASPLVLLEFQCPTTQVRNDIRSPFMFIATFFSFLTVTLGLITVCCYVCPVMCGKLSWQAYDIGESQDKQQRPWILQTIL